MSFFKRRTGMIAMSAAAAIALAMTGEGTWLAAQPVTRGGSLTYLVEPEPAGLSPIIANSGPTTAILSKIYEGLLTYDFAQNPAPGLAVSWTSSPDFRHFTFHLHQGVTWHDGKPFTSADVAFSIALMRERNLQCGILFRDLDQVSQPDALTVDLTFKQSAPFLLQSLQVANLPILPAHIFGAGDPLKATANTAPIGTGPFIFKEWVRGSHLILTRNPHYRDASLPYIDRIVVRVIPDAASRVVALEAGEVQLAGESPVPFSDIARLRQVRSLQFDARGYDRYAGIVRLEFNLDNPYFKDIRVRQAIAHAVDRDAILRDVWSGQGEIVHGPIPPSMKAFYEPDVPRYDFDIARATALLDEAGYKAGPDGIRFSLPVDYLPIGDRSRRLADFLRGVFEKVGIRLTVRGQDFPSYIRRVYVQRDFALTVHSLAAGVDPVLNVQRLYWSQWAKRGLPFANASGYSNPEVDHLLEQAATEPDAQKRRAAYSSFQKIIARDVPAINLIAQTYLTISSARLRDHTVDGDGVSYGNLAHAYFETSGE